MSLHLTFSASPILAMGFLSFQFQIFYSLIMAFCFIELFYLFLFFCYLLLDVNLPVFFSSCKMFSSRYCFCFWDWNVFFRLFCFLVILSNAFCFLLAFGLGENSGTGPLLIYLLSLLLLLIFFSFSSLHYLNFLDRSCFSILALSIHN